MNRILCLLRCATAVLDGAAANTEHTLETLRMSAGNLDGLKEHATVSNAVADGQWVSMRGADGEGAMVVFSEANREDSWAIEITIKKAPVKHLAKAGLYLWYTRDPLRAGKFRGGEGNFTGFFAGIEFLTGKTDLAFSYNYGVDLTDRPDAAIKRDHVDPGIISHLDEITLKIVHTHNNFIMELYSGDALISDSFRIHDSLMLVGEDKASYFGITSTYEDCPPSIAIKIKDVKILRRDEGEHYRSGDTHVPLNTYAHDEGTEEITHAVADAEHFMAYLLSVLHSDDKNVFDVILSGIREEMRDQRGLLDRLIARAREARESEDGDLAKAAMARIGAFDARLQDVYARMELLRKKMAAVGSSGDESLSRGVYLLLIIFTVLACAVLILKQVVLRVFSTKALLSKNN